MALEITTANFEEVTATDQLVVIDFWAEWCGPCRMMAPIIEEMAARYEGKAVIGKCDVDNNDAIAMKYSIRNIPTVILIKNGEMVDKQVGLCSKDSLAEKIEKNL